MRRRVQIALHDLAMWNRCEVAFAAVLAAVHLRSTGSKSMASLKWLHSVVCLF
jgi:hypothetical protein